MQTNGYHDFEIVTTGAAGPRIIMQLAEPGESAFAPGVIDEIAAESGFTVDWSSQVRLTPTGCDPVYVSAPLVEGVVCYA